MRKQRQLAREAENEPDTATIVKWYERAMAQARYRQEYSLRRWQKRKTCMRGASMKAMQFPIHKMNAIEPDTESQPHTDWPTRKE